MRLLKLNDWEKEQFKKAIANQSVVEWLLLSNFEFVDDEKEAHVKISGNKIENLFMPRQVEYMNNAEKIKYWNANNYTKYAQCDYCKIYFTKKIENKLDNKHICYNCFISKATLIEKE